mmetsp:Transcript_4793/g.8218  ORF Transcript_4793/g.8218 Transcript_4793/m.8218 type:complete len:277 (-) Transcript_4793:350-1180(-)
MLLGLPRLLRLFSLLTPQMEEVRTLILFLVICVFEKELSLVDGAGEEERVGEVELQVAGELHHALDLGHERLNPDFAVQPLFALPHLKELQLRVSQELVHYLHLGVEGVVKEEGVGGSVAKVDGRVHSWQSLLEAPPDEVEEAVGLVEGQHVVLDQSLLEVLVHLLALKVSLELLQQLIELNQASLLMQHSQVGLGLEVLRPRLDLPKVSHLLEGLLVHVPEYFAGGDHSIRERVQVPKAYKLLSYLLESELLRDLLQVGQVKLIRIQLGLLQACF